MTAPLPTSFDGRRILAVTAHPDDEVLAFGGTLARSADVGGIVGLLCLTRGELGWAGAAPSPERIPELIATRRRELERSAAVLGVAQVEVLEFPDSRLHELAHALMVEAIAASLARWRPDVVLTFGEDGLYWHTDHTTVYYVTTRAVRERPEPRPALFHAVFPRGIARAVTDAVMGHDSRAANVTWWGVNPDAFGLHAVEPTEYVDVRAYVGRKMAALRCHESQFPPGHVLSRLGEAEAERLLGVEYFHRSLEL